MAENQVSQGGITVAAELIDAHRQQVSQGGITVASEPVDPTVQVSQGGITVVSCVAITDPTGFSAEASGDDVVLAWTDNEDTNDYYRVDYSADGVSWSTLSATIDGDAETYTHADILSGEACGEDFYYRLYVIVEGLCEGVYDPVATDYTLVAPTAPSDLTSELVDTSVVLEWVDNSSTEAGFVLERGTNGVDFTAIATLDADVVTYTDASVTPGVRYYYRIYAFTGGCDSSYSDTSTVFVAPTFAQPCPPIAIYQLLLYDADGVFLAVIDEYRSLQYGHTVNGAGFFTLQISYNDSKRALFERDCILVIKRKVPSYLDWYTEFVGHCEDFSSTFYSNGNTQFTIVGSGLNGLLGRVIVAYDEGTDEAEKEAESETAMKEYVKENRGDLATTANGRLADGRIIKFYVDTDEGNGAEWKGERSGKNLLEALQDIANFSGIDFNVIVHPTEGIGNYLFKTYVGQLGVDRTTTGIDTSTGLNSSGNTPHVFSLERGNIEIARFQEKHKQEINRVYIFGQDRTTGLGTVTYREAPSAISSDNISLREAMRGGSSQQDEDKMNDLADEYLEENQFVGRFEATPLDQPSSVYGLHYAVGDRVTFRLIDEEYNKRLVRVSVTVNGESGGESNKEFEFKDVP
jgi:hypothetical protein